MLGSHAEQGQHLKDHTEVFRLTFYNINNNNDFKMCVFVCV